MNNFALPLLLAFHLMCMNVAAAGPLVCMWLEWREGRGDALAGRVGRYLALCGIVLLLVGMLLGTAMGVLLWSDSYRTAIVQVRSRVEYGVAELLFSLVLMVGHLVWWRFRPDCGRPERWLRLILPLAAGTNLLYHFPPLFTVISQLAASPAGEPLSSAEFRARMFDNEVLARWVHFVLAAAAMCGVVLIGYAMRLGRRKADPEEVHRVALWGARLALGPTVVQMVVGLWVLLALPEPIKTALMGGDTASAVLFCVSLLSALLLMHHLGAVAFGDVERRRLVRAMVSMVVVVVLMSAMLERTRGIPRIAPPAAPVPQNKPDPQTAPAPD